MKCLPILVTVILFGACAADQTSTQQTPEAPAAPAEEQTGTASMLRPVVQEGTEGSGSLTGSTTNSASPKIFNAGEKISFEGLELTINGTKPNTIRRGDGEVHEQTAIMVSITAANSGGAAKTLLPAMFHLKGENGTVYRPSDQGGKLFKLPKFPVFDGVELQPKGSSIITLVFEIPRENVFDLVCNWGPKNATVRLGLDW